MMISGAVSVDDGIKQMTDALNAAGIDQVLADRNAQYKEWVAQQSASQ